MALVVSGVGIASPGPPPFLLIGPAAHARRFMNFDDPRGFVEQAPALAPIPVENRLGAKRRRTDARGSLAAISRDQ